MCGSIAGGNDQLFSVSAMHHPRILAPSRHVMHIQNSYTLSPRPPLVSLRGSLTAQKQTMAEKKGTYSEVVFLCSLEYAVQLHVLWRSFMGDTLKH